MMTRLRRYGARALVSLAMLVFGAGCSERRARTSADIDAEGEDEEPAPKWDGADSATFAAEGRSLRYARVVEDHTAPRKGGRPMATYPGFHSYEDGTSRVVLEVTGAVDVDMTRDVFGLKFRFVGVQVGERVNRLALPTVHFDAVVTHVELQQVGDDAVLVVQTRVPVEPKTKLLRRAIGTVLTVDFPRQPRPGEGIPKIGPISDEPTRLEADGVAATSVPEDGFAEAEEGSE
ncbi:MAG: hypothetical protein AAGA56_13065 [Myxococcota bacterium]